MNRKEILRIEDLAVYFYTYAGVVKAIEGLNLSIYEGECFGLVGETGCGKSVSMRAVLRLIPPPGRIVRGKIFFKGVNLLELPEKEMQKIRGYKISMIFQEPGSALDPLFTNGYQVMETILSHEKQVSKKDALKKVLNLFKIVKIPEAEERINQYPHELSGGLKQRVVISIALAGRPNIIIADEPTTALDVTIQAQILDLLKELQSKYNTTLILITHNLGIVAEYCDRVGVMYAGKLVELGSVNQIFKNPLHPYTRGLMASIPSFSRSKRLKSIPGSVPNLIYPPQGCRFHPRCDKAMSTCSRVEPRLVEVEEGHYVACHLYGGDDR